MLFRSEEKGLGDIFPLDPNINEKKLREWIKELIQEKLLIPITYKNKRLLFVKGWGEHQTVQHKSKRSHVESCDLEQVIKDSLKSHESLVSIYLDSHAPKRKKKEKEEREIEKAKASSEDEIISFCLETGLLKSDGEYYWQHWISNGWMNNGKPIKDWRACIRKWKNLNYCPSQKNQQSNDQDLF